MSAETCNPLVSFIVLGFNQQDLIRAAIQGAFDQQYQPLEIILSDDASSDATYEIMREMAARYQGPHEVKVVQNSENKKVFGHVVTRGREASGEIVILAAGDDISEPERTARIVDAFAAHPSAGCVSSAVSEIDVHGLTICRNRRPQVSRPPIVARPDNQPPTSIIGCSAAYRKWVFDLPIDPSGKIYAEDMAFSVYLDLMSADSVCLEEPLVRYRVHAGAATNVLPSPCEYEKVARTAAAARVDFLRECQAMANSLGKRDHLSQVEISKAMAQALRVCEWPDLSFIERLNNTFQPTPAYGWRWNLGNSLWSTLRLIGSFPNYQPLLFFSRFRKRYRRGLFKSATRSLAGNSLIEVLKDRWPI